MELTEFNHATEYASKHGKNQFRKYAVLAGSRPGADRRLVVAADHLNALADNGIVARRAYQQRPARHEYVLTEAGRDLVPAILALTAWGDRWAQPKEGSPILFVHKSCGHQFRPLVTCAVCGGEIRADAVTALPGPGGAAKPGTRVVARRLKEKLQEKLQGAKPRGAGRAK